MFQKSRFFIVNVSQFERSCLETTGPSLASPLHSLTVSVASPPSYKQRKFNLFREESEGYAKLLVELNQEQPSQSPEHMLEVIKAIIGRWIIVGRTSGSLPGYVRLQASYSCRECLRRFVRC